MAREAIQVMDCEVFQIAKIVSLNEAISRIKPGSNLVIPPGCGEPQTLVDGLVSDCQRLKDTRILSGLLLSDYKFLAPGVIENFKYSTWHVMKANRDLVSNGSVEFLPARASQVPMVLDKIGLDAAFIQVSPPDCYGYCSLGVSVSYPLMVAKRAKTVIAEINAQMPRTLGNSFIHLSEIDWAIEVDRPLISYKSSTADQVSRQIGSYVLDMIPDGAIIQFGIGSVPEALLELLKDVGKRVSIWGMGIDSIVDLAEAGVLKPIPGKGICSVVSAELMGTEKLFNFAHNNPMVEMHPASYTINPEVMGRYENFISINSAVQVDLWGQANVEYAGGKQISGVGGGFDFVEGAVLSSGGKSILAIPSTSGKGKNSTIVPRLSSSVPIGNPRHTVQYVVTENGVASLFAKSLHERAEALISIANPEYQDKLWSDYENIVKGKEEAL